MAGQPPRPSSSLHPYSSEALQLAELELRFPRGLDIDAHQRRQLALSANQLDAASSRVSSSLDQVRGRIRERALDDDFSTALRERWQRWSRVGLTPGVQESAMTADPRGAPSPSMAVAATTDTRDAASTSLPAMAETPDRGADPQSVEPGATPQESSARPIKRQRHGRGHAQPVDEDWGKVRRTREERLRDMDRRLPRAFRFTTEQTTAFSRRLKSKHLNALDRPFVVEEIRHLVHGNAIADVPRGSADSAGPSQRTASPASRGADGPSREVDETTASGGAQRPLVLQVSFFFSSPHINFDIAETDGETDDAATAAEAGAAGRATKQKTTNTGFNIPRPATRGTGDGPAGMRRSQTIEVRSDQRLATISNSMFCWSDDQPERVGWRLRLARDALGDEADEALSQVFDGAGVGQESGAIDENGQEAAFARFTGKKRPSDFCMAIEDRLYGSGFRVGDRPWEADYATLLGRHLSDCDDPQQQPGDLSLRFDELPSLRVGQPCWILHQGDCVHCFTLDSVRALRPEEEEPQQEGQSNDTTPRPTLPSAPLFRFPRVVWLSTSAILRFTSHAKDNVGIGQRILNAAGHAPYAYRSTSLAGVRGAEHSKAKAWAPRGPERRREESMLKTKYGKCFACQIRKAQICIVGGERVRVRKSSPTPDAEWDDDEDEEMENEEQDDTTLRGLDDHIVSICPQCAVVMGIARLKRQSPPAVDMDGERRDRDDLQLAEPVADSRPIGNINDDPFELDTGSWDPFVEPATANPSATESGARSKAVSGSEGKGKGKGKASAKGKTKQSAKASLVPRPLNISVEDIEIDWTVLNADPSRDNGWTVFPLY